MLVKNLLKCPRCGETVDKLVNHHTSYLPEIIETICCSCDQKEKRRIKKNRGLEVLNVHPQRGLIMAPKDLLEHFGGQLENETAPITPVGIIFPYGLSLEEIKCGTDLALRTIELNIKHSKRNSP